MVKWITQSLGTAAWDQLGDRSGIEVVDVRNMVDKDGNSRQDSLAAVEQVVKLLRLGKHVVVCCDYGMSRSNAVAAGALALHLNLRFGDAVREVVSHTGEQEIKAEVLAAIEDAVSEQIAPASSLHTSQERTCVLITGGSGFIGKHLAERLSKSCTVIAPSRSLIDLTQGSAELSLLLKEHQVAKVVHLAAPRIYNSNAAIGAMLVAIKNMIDACRVQRVKIVFVSSWEIYSGYCSQSLLANESVPANPKSQYGLAKWLCERMLEQEKSCWPDLDYTIVRLAPVYGAGSTRPRFIYRFMELARCGEPIVTHRYLNGLPMLDLIHIDDAVSALARVAEKQVSGAFNVGSGIARSTTEVAQIITQILDSQSRISSTEITGFASNIVMDSTRAHNLLDWQPKANLMAELQKLTENSHG